MKDLNNIFIFVKVAESENFTKASQLLGISSSAVSKIITRFEEELGVRLFNRTTRAVHLTNDGSRFLERCRQVLAVVAEAEDVATQTCGSLKGTVRLTMPVGVGRRIFVPALTAFAERFPDITLEAEFSDRVVDLAYEPIDVAIVRGVVPDARLLAKRICTLNFIPCASPDYLAKHGVPVVPEDLIKHHCLVSMGPQMSRYREWTFARDGKTFNMAVSGRINMNSGESLLDASIAGLGIIMINNMYTAEAIRTGKLKPILKNYLAPGIPVSAVYLPNKNLSPRVKAIIDFLVHLVPETPALDNSLGRGLRLVNA